MLKEIVPAPGADGAAREVLLKRRKAFATGLVQRVNSKSWHERGRIEAPVLDGFSRFGSADEIFAWRRRRCEAEFKLAMMAGQDELIEAEKKLDVAQDLSPAEVVSWRRVFRSQYRRTVGVEMEQRDRLVRELRAAAETGARTVAEIMADINRSQRNRVSPGLTGEDCGGVDWL